MASPAPRVTSSRPSRSNGLLSIPASATQRKPGPAHETPISKGTSARQKIVIRRLPPGLTQPEFEEILGYDWKGGGAKVDWAVYKVGKVSKDPAKPSRPSRAYLHLTKQEHLIVLSEHVRNTTFIDAKGSFKDTALLGPPSVEFAPYGRIPNSRPRKDARQGTIDQDPEFIDFLESLTNPVAKLPSVDQESDTLGKSKDKPTVTPLIQFLRDKKANKSKDSNALSKGTKNVRQDPKDGKITNVADTKSATGINTVSSPKKRSAQAVKVEQAARDAVRVLNKQALTTNRGTASATSLSPSAIIAKVPAVPPSSTANAALADKKRERGNASAAAKILQRDLGLGGNIGGKTGRRGPVGNIARAGAANATDAPKQDTGVSQSAGATASQPEPSTASSLLNPPVAASTSPAKQLASQPPTGPAASRTPARSSNLVTRNRIASGNPQSLTPRPVPPPSTATQAFLKHANPSQGITEPLLEEAFAVFGTINKVEIDKKKGFAYVDFAEPESLQKAVKVSPIKVAQGQVVVLERKSGPNLQARNLRSAGGLMVNRGGGMPLGGRGGSMRGRGGYGRGGINMPNNARFAPNAASKPSGAAVQDSQATPADIEAPTATSSDPTLAIPTAPAAD